MSEELELLETDVLPLVWYSIYKIVWRLTLDRDVHLLTRTELQRVVDAFEQDGKPVNNGYSLNGSTPSPMQIDAMVAGTYTGRYWQQPYITDFGLRRAKHQLKLLDAEQRPKRTRGTVQDYDEHWPAVAERTAKHLLRIKAGEENPLHHLASKALKAYNKERLDQGKKPMATVTKPAQKIIKEIKQKYHNEQRKNTR